jgi:hypothetical protein
VKWVPPLLILCVALIASGSTYVARRRSGRGTRLDEGDWAIAWLLGLVVTALVLFVGAVWWFDQPVWLSGLISLGGTVFGAFWLLMLAPDSGVRDD